MISLSSIATSPTSPERELQVSPMSRDFAETSYLGSEGSQHDPYTAGSYSIGYSSKYEESYDTSADHRDDREDYMEHQREDHHTFHQHRGSNPSDAGSPQGEYR